MRNWFFIFLAFSPIICAQTSTPSSHPADESEYDGGTYGYANIFAGPSAGGSIAKEFIGVAGVTLGEFHALPLRKGGGASFPTLELGVMGPVAGHSIDGFVSINGVLMTILRHHDTFPFLTGGYTRIFATGNALNYGIGFDLGSHKSDRLVRIELRDYYLITRPQHVVGLRLAWGTSFSDN